MLYTYAMFDKAVEHLFLSQRVTSEWTAAMERAVATFRNQADVPVLHAMLLVQTKILSVYKRYYYDRCIISLTRSYLNRS